MSDIHCVMADVEEEKVEQLVPEQNKNGCSLLSMVVAPYHLALTILKSVS